MSSVNFYSKEQVDTLLEGKQDAGSATGPTVVQSTGSSAVDVMSQNATTTALNAKQSTLVSGSNIKTINGASILGSGNISVGNTGFYISTTSTFNNCFTVVRDINAKIAYVIAEKDICIAFHWGTENASFLISKGEMFWVGPNNNSVTVEMYLLPVVRSVANTTYLLLRISTSTSGNETVSDTQVSIRTSNNTVVPREQTNITGSSIPNLCYTILLKE